MDGYGPRLMHHVLVSLCHYTFIWTLVPVLVGSASRDLNLHSEYLIYFIFLLYLFTSSIVSHNQTLKKRKTIKPLTLRYQHTSNMEIQHEKLKQTDPLPLRPSLVAWPVEAACG